MYLQLLSAFSTLESATSTAFTELNFFADSVMTSHTVSICGEGVVLNFPTEVAFQSTPFSSTVPTRAGPGAPPPPEDKKLIIASIAKLRP